MTPRLLAAPSIAAMLSLGIAACSDSNARSDDPPPPDAQTSPDAPAAEKSDSEAPGDLAAVLERASRASGEVNVAGRLNGSGFFASAGGDFLTAAHVVAGHDEVEVVHADFGRLPARVLARDRNHDIALLGVALPAGQHAPFVPVAAEIPPLAAPIYLRGTPIYRHDVLITGAVARRVPTHEWLPDQGRYVGCFFGSAMSPRGTSGGLWMDARGEAVGVQSGMMLDKGAPQGIAFIAPPQALRRLLAERHDIPSPWSGMAVEELWEQGSEYRANFPGIQEALVAAQVVDNGPAQAAGVPKRALVLEANGRRLTYRDDFFAVIRSLAPGDKVTLKLRPPEGGEDFTAEIELRDH